MTTYISPVLEQDKDFIKEATLLDFSKNMGCYGLEIKYTNGDSQMFTTPMENPNCFGSHEFETKEELIKFKKNLQI